MIKFFDIEAFRYIKSIRYDTVRLPNNRLWAYPKNIAELCHGRDYAIFDSQRLKIDLKWQGTEWLDCVPYISGGTAHYLIISERVVDSLIKNGARGFALFLTDIKLNPAGKKAPRNLGEYYIMLTIGKPLAYLYRLYLTYCEGDVNHVELLFETRDRNEIEERRKLYSEKKIEVPGTLPSLPAMPIPILSSWDGSDFLLSGRNPVFMLCSRKIVELAHKESWTNFTFKPVSNFGTTDHRFEELPWPPETWPPNTNWYPAPPYHFVEK
jgi:hypothetical protein